MISKSLLALLLLCAAGSRGRADPRCTDPCLFLASTALDKLPEAFAAACPGATAPELGDCAAVDDARNCIYAAHGVTFRKKKWREHFAARPWYKPRGVDASTLALSAVERANVKALVARGKACKRDFSIDKADLARVKAWLAALPKAPTPKLVFEADRSVAGGELEHDILDAFAQAQATLSLDRATARYVRPRAREVPEALAKAITGMTPVPRLIELDLAITWEDDGWDSGEYVWLAYDAAGQLVAVSAQDWP